MLFSPPLHRAAATLWPMGLLLVSFRAAADEGLWTFDNPPTQLLRKNTTSLPPNSGSTTSACRACA